MIFTPRCVHYTVGSVLYVQDQQNMFSVRSLLGGQKFASDTEVQISCLSVASTAASIVFC